MNGLEVLLPGGLVTDNGIERRVRFRELSGFMELALAELEVGVPRPVYVTSVLVIVLECIGHSVVDEDTISSLCNADREFLMLRLSDILSGEQQWLKVTCGYCNVFFDVEYRRCDLPVKVADTGYPFGDVDLKDGVVKVRVPTAVDQLDLIESPDISDQEAMTRLLHNCIYSVNHSPASRETIGSFSEKDLAAIDDALEKISPAVCCELLVVCPECNNVQKTQLNHYLLSGLDQGSFYHEVHTLAMHYHWSETEILEMSRSRRHRYLKLIDRSRAMTG